MHVFEVQMPIASSEVLYTDLSIMTCSSFSTEKPFIFICHT